MNLTQLGPQPLPLLHPMEERAGERRRLKKESDHPEMAPSSALPMNQPLSRPSATLSPPCGERAGRGETRRGSWPRFTSEFWRCSLSMNPDEHRTSNIEHRTANIEWQRESSLTRRSKLDVRRSMFSFG